MKSKNEGPSGVQELCRKLKLQLDELAVTMAAPNLPNEEKARRTELMEQLKRQLVELSQ
jgi:hypothetical protein